MARKSSSILTDLSTGDLKRLLAARERIDVLEGEQQRLMAQLAKVEKELTHLLDGGSVVSGRGPGKSRGRKKSVSKAAGVKKAGKTKVRRKKSAARKASGRVKLEDVIVAVLAKNGQPMNFKELFGTIVEGKLVKTKSKNFDNVLRRTLSTSKLVKRVARGIYDTV